MGAVVNEKAEKCGLLQEKIVHKWLPSGISDVFCLNSKNGGTRTGQGKYSSLALTCEPKWAEMLAANLLLDHSTALWSGDDI